MTEQYIKVYIIYSEMFGSKKPKQEIEAFIKSVPLLELLISLSVMSFTNRQEEEQIKNEFCSYLTQEAIKNGNDYDPREILNERSVFSSQGILATWKWLLAMGDITKKRPFNSLKHGMNMAIYLQSAIAEYLYEENTAEDDSIIYELFKNNMFNSRDNFFSMIVRTKTIFIDIAKQKSLFNPQEYVDFNADFKKQYGYIIEDYLAVLNGLMALYFEAFKTGTTLTDLELAFKRTKTKELIADIIEPLCFSFEEGKHWAENALDNPWDFRFFREKPILKLEENKILPVSMNYLVDQLFLSLYWKIRKCYPSEDTNFIRFYGRPFEIYIQNLLQGASEKSKLEYLFFNEFLYDGKRSPDAFLMLGDKLLVIEGKAKSVTESSAIEGDPDSIEEDFKKLVIDPYNQVKNRLLEIKDCAKVPIDLSMINSYYIVTVNQNDFPHLKPYEDRMWEMVDCQKELPIKYFGHFGIEEYELLCSLIGRPNKKPIFRILDQHIQVQRYSGFKNFLHSFHYPVRMPDDMRAVGRGIMEYSLKRLFE